MPLEELGLGGQTSPPASPEAASASSSRSSSPSLTEGPHALLGSLLDEAESSAAAAAVGAGGGDHNSPPRPPITYLLIYEDERISLGVFCLPARARIPLHNHPGMTVLSRCVGRAGCGLSAQGWRRLLLAGSTCVALCCCRRRAAEETARCHQAPTLPSAGAVPHTVCKPC